MKDTFETLNENEIRYISGGTPLHYYAGAVAFGAYLSVLDVAWSFGEGLGNGLYDALHKQP